jgi:hypothetical protein
MRITRKVERQARLELAWNCLEGNRTTFIPLTHKMVDLRGIGPRPPRCKRDVLPLSLEAHESGVADRNRTCLSRVATGYLAI